jgi:large subunit ribosomal protein L15
MTLKTIKDNKGARILKTKLGRGPGSGKGKTSARGHKGYKARVGNVNRHYEGGSTPITRRLPKHGFRHVTGREHFSYLNIDKILYLINKGRLDATKPITIRELFWAGAVSKVREGIKLLSKGVEDLKHYPPLNFEVSSASQTVIDELKKHGGSVNIVYRTEKTVAYQTKPWKFIREPIEPIPKFKKVVRLLHFEEKGAKYYFINF